MALWALRSPLIKINHCYYYLLQEQVLVLRDLPFANAFSVGHRKKGTLFRIPVTKFWIFDQIFYGPRDFLNHVPFPRTRFSISASQKEIR